MNHFIVIRSRLMIQLISSQKSVPAGEESLVLSAIHHIYLPLNTHEAPWSPGGDRNVVIHSKPPRGMTPAKPH